MRHERRAIRGNLFTSRAWKWWIPRLLAGALGLILIIAGVLKATDMELFIRQMKDYGIISHQVILTLGAWALIAIECAIGVGLLILYRPKLMLPLTAMLFLTFLGSTVWAWATGATEECGCFGAWLEYTPREATAENLILLAATAVAWVGLRHGQSPQTRGKPWAVMVAFLIGLMLPVVFGFSISRVAQSPWRAIETELARLQIQALDAIDLKQGSFLVVLMDTACLHCEEAVPDLDALAEDAALPSVVVLSMNEQEERADFVEKFQTAFRIRQIETDTFWRLLGTGDVPRTILLRKGRVLGVWDRDVPDKETIQMAL